MSGIVFLNTRDRHGITRFYQDVMGMSRWLEQPKCTLLSHGNLVLGLLERGQPVDPGIITFFYRTRAQVDEVCEILGDRVERPPKVSEEFRIYNAFARDPEGRQLEIQTFLHPVPQFPGAFELLNTRRSIRHFLPDPVPRSLLMRVFESCRFAPTARHSESFYYVATDETWQLEALAKLRDHSSAPIARAPAAVAVCSDPRKSGLCEADANIAAYHFILAAWQLGLGTCWIGSMNRPETKQILQIPEDHFVATVTPVGFPAERPQPKERRQALQIVRFM